jgi:hypothetical protein
MYYDTCLLLRHEAQDLSHCSAAVGDICDEVQQAICGVCIRLSAHHLMHFVLHMSSVLSINARMW